MCAVQPYIHASSYHLSNNLSKGTGGDPPQNWPSCHSLTVQSSVFFFSPFFFSAFTRFAAFFSFLGFGEAFMASLWGVLVRHLCNAGMLDCSSQLHQKMYFFVCSNNWMVFYVQRLQVLNGRFKYKPTFRRSLHPHICARRFISTILMHWV